MSSRWTTLLMDSADLTRLPEVPIGQVSNHAESIFGQRLGPMALYRRWETQQWEAEAVPLAADREEFEALPLMIRGKLRELLNTFVVGEYTGLDLLGPILGGCPDEQSLIYLGTQVADESRHTILLAKIAVDLLGMEPDLRSMLPLIWAEMTSGHRELSVVEADLVRDLAAKPSDYGRWIRAVTHFHLITEGVLALNAQRNLIKGLRHRQALPGLQAGFIAMARDESRHVSYGMHALRQGLREGCHDEVMDVLEHCAPLAVHIEQRGPQETAHARRTARELTKELERRLVQLDLPRTSIDHIVTVAGRPFTPPDAELADA
jgi:ribonucleotide reductase beta subunit family protein with ferritin-like domain